MQIERPYFMTNDDWWERDEEHDIIKLSQNAPQTKKIIDSYQMYVKAHFIGKMTRGGCKMDFDIDDDVQFEKFMNELMK